MSFEAVIKNISLFLIVVVALVLSILAVTKKCKDNFAENYCYGFYGDDSYLENQAAGGPPPASVFGSSVPFKACKPKECYASTPPGGTYVSCSSNEICDSIWHASLDEWQKSAVWPVWLGDGGKRKPPNMSRCCDDSKVSKLEWSGTEYDRIIYKNCMSSEEIN